MMPPDPFHADPANWSRGWFKLYFSRADMRLLVPKYRPMLGWTINFAHPAAGLLVLTTIVLVVAATAISSSWR